MNITEPFILSQDAEWIAVEILPPKIQRLFDWQPGDYAIMRPRKRTLPKLINAQVVDLVEEFRSQTTIVEAILRYCNRHNTDPKNTLYEAFPVLQQLIQARLLVSAEEAGKPLLTYEPGNWVVGAQVLDCIQSMEDTEVYCVLRNGRKEALKIAVSELYKTMLQKEVRILKQLDGQFAPNLITTGLEERGYPYILMEWLEGISIDASAEQLRGLERSKLLKLCVALLRTYERLHAQGLIHGDIHPRNIFVCSEEIKLIDFGLCRQIDDPASLVGGVHFFFAPEQAESFRTKQKLGVATFLSEQYALAALIYQLIVGNYHIDFTIEQSELLRQIAEENTLAFSYWGQAPWPEVEIPLQKALSKASENRFESVGAFADALECCLAPEMPLIFVQAISIQTYLKTFLELTHMDGMLLNAPWSQTTTASIFGGAPGIAYALYRMACLRSDPALLATADLWATRASQHREITNEQTAYFSLGEVHCVQGMIAHAYDIDTLVHEATQDFLNEATLSQTSFALLPGVAGTLHACTLLLETIGKRQDLLEKGNSLLEAIWKKPVATFSILDLGMAHGWSGILYATLRWCYVAQIPLPSQLQYYLEKLVALAEPSENGQRWPWRMGKKGYLSGWCNGNAGFYYLWIQASKSQLGKHYISLAESSAQQCWESPSQIPNLCCGVAGQIYVLLHFYQHTGEFKWRERAFQLVKKLAMRPKSEHTSLYQGNVGIALLAAELDFPQHACMPFFAGEATL